MNEEDEEILAGAEEVSDEEFLDDDFSEEGWDEGDYDEALPEDEDHAPVEKKKNPKFNMMLIGGGVVVGVIVLYMNMGAAPPPPANVPPPQQQAAAAPPPTQPAPAAQQKQEVKADDPSGGFFNDPAAFDDFEKIRSNMEFEDYQEGDDQELDATTQEDAVAAPVAPSMPLTPLPVAVENPPVPQDLPDMAPTPFDQASSESQNSELQESVDAIGNQISDLVARMDDFEGTLGELQIPVVDSNEIADLKATIKNLEKKIEGLSTRAPKPTKASSARKSSVTAKPSPKPSAAASPAVRSKSVAWVLKSAQPGRAILGKSGSDEVYAISVGDKIEGIGQIKSIGQDGGRWVVQGSSGQILQQ